MAIYVTALAFEDVREATRISQGYHPNHYGIDIVHATYQEIANDYPLYAVAAGKIIVSKYSETAGYYTVITLDDGYTVRYLHMKELPLVRVEERVTSDTCLGLVGNTGDSDGAHLHFDVNNLNLTSGGDGSNGINYNTTFDPILFFPDISFTY